MLSFFLFGLLLPFFLSLFQSSCIFLISCLSCKWKWLYTVIGFAIFQKQVTVLEQQLIPPLVSQLITVCLIWPRLLSSSFAPSTLNPVNCILISIRLCLDFYIILSYKTKIHWYKSRGTVTPEPKNVSIQSHPLHNSPLQTKGGENLSPAWAIVQHAPRFFLRDYPVFIVKCHPHFYTPEYYIFQV